MKLTVGLLVYNGAKYLPALFESLKKQTFQNFELIVVDNGSSDGSVEILKMASPSFQPATPERKRGEEGARGELPSFETSSPLTSATPPSLPLERGGSQKMRFIRNPANIGFAAGHNQIFELSKSPYYLALNQDVKLAPDCLEKMIAFLDTHPDTAAVAPKLLKWNFASSSQPTTSNKIDSLGLKVLRNRRVIDIKSVPRPTSHVPQIEVFGVSAACALYRRTTIESAGGLFDQYYFAYKEDVDLAFRLRSTGFSSYTILDTSAYHARTGADSGSDSDAKQADNKAKQSGLIKYYSYRNHLITLLKNEYGPNLILDFPWILWYELKKFAYYILFDRAVLKGLDDIWKMRKKLKIERLRIDKLRKSNWRQIRQSFRLPK